MTESLAAGSATSERMTVSWGCNSCGTSDTGVTDDPEWLARARSFLVQHERCLTTVTLPEPAPPAE